MSDLPYLNLQNYSHKMNYKYVDLVHMPLNGHEFVSDAKYTIADLLEKPGCTLGYLYDLVRPSDLRLTPLCQLMFIITID